MKRFFTFFLFLFTIQFNGFSSGCGIAIQSLGFADGTFESLAGIASDSALNANVTGGGWTNVINTADSWITPLPNNTYQAYAGGMSASPDGGIFAALLTYSNFYEESFSTTITGLTIGK